MLKETLKNRIDNNKCFICNIEFTKEYLKNNDIRTVFYTSLNKKVKICKKHNFFEESKGNAI